MATLLEMASEIVTAHASTTKLSADELLLAIQKVYATLQALEAGKPAEAAEQAKPEITPKQSIKANEIICLVCGKGGMKTLTRHLSQAHNMKPGEYKKQFGIPSKQPLAAKKFSEERRKMAMDRGMADLLAKAREKRAANIKAKKTAPAKKTAKKPARTKAAPSA